MKSHTRFLHRERSFPHSTSKYLNHILPTVGTKEFKPESEELPLLYIDHTIG
jgi:hypothetical protein